MDFLSKFDFLGKYLPLYVEGVFTTIGISFFTVLTGTLIGVILAIMKLSKIKIIKSISVLYIEVVRGTPLILQVMLFYHGLSTIIHIPDIYITDSLNLARLIPGILALSINSGAYIAEIIRAGINAVDKGQTEAGKSLGMKDSLILKSIIMPQAIKNILPAICNEFIVLIKESSVLYVIGIQELMTKADSVAVATYQPIEPLLVAGVLYFTMTFSVSRIFGKIERNLNKT